VALTIVSSLLLTANAIGIAQSRQLDRIRENYSAKSIEGLLAIARDKKDQYAIDALAARADSASIQSRALILLNDNERGNLRYAAAQALARIGRRTRGAEKSSGFLQGRIFQGPYQSDCRGYDAVHALTVRNTRSLLVPKPLDPSSPGLPRLRTWSAESSAAPHPDLSTYAQHHTAR